MSILIAGGGIGGLCAAIALARHDLPSHIFEQADAFSEVGAGIQVGPNGMRILAHWGLSELLENKGATPEAVQIFDGLTGAKLNKVPLGDTAEQRYGAPYRVFHRAELQMALLEKARAMPQVTITTGFQVKDYSEEKDGILLRSVGGDQQKGNVLIGADGLWSVIRRQLYPGITPAFFGKSAWRAIVPREQAPEPFNAMQTGLWMAPDAHLVHYPVMGGDAINIVAVIRERFDQQGWTTQGQSSELLSHYMRWDDVPHNFLRSVTNWQKWALYSLPRLPTWSKGRVTLLGDAAHPPIPFLAQGGVMAMEDAFVLAQELDTCRDQLEKGFPRYENQRRDRAYHVMDTADKLGKIYHMKGLMRLARNTVLRRKCPQSLLADYDWLYGFDIDTIS